MSHKKRLETDGPLGEQPFWGGVIFGVFAGVILLFVCILVSGHFDRIDAMEGRIYSHGVQIEELQNNVIKQNREEINPPSIINCDEFRRLVSAVPAGSVIILGEGTIVEEPCK